MTARRMQIWTPEEDAQLRAHYATMHTPALAALLGRPLPGLYKRAKRLGLTKPHVLNPDFRPHNVAAIGAITTAGRHGYQYVKVREGAWPDAWMPLHYQAWEAVHGPVPDDHVLTFRDGDIKNVDPANLELVAKRDWISRYQSALTPELKRLTRLKGALTRAIHDAERRAKPADEE